MARVAIFEDKPLWRMVFESYLLEAGHQVVASVANFAEAQELLAADPPIDIDGALVDGNLSEGERDGHEGAYLASILKNQGRWVIGVSSDGTVEGADLNVPKAHPDEIQSAISNIAA